MKAKRFFNLLIIGLILSLGYTSCSDDDKEIDVTGITLNTSSLILEKGNTDQLSVTAFSPTDATKKTITWTSSNTAIATVDNTGKVSGAEAGQCSITAKAESGITAICEIAVYSGDEPKRLAWNGITSDSIVLNMDVLSVILVYDEQMNLVHKITNGLNTPFSVPVPANGSLKSTNPINSNFSIESETNLSHLEISNNDNLQSINFYKALSSLIVNNCPNLQVVSVHGATQISDVHSDVLDTLENISGITLVINSKGYRYEDGEWKEVQS